MEDFHKKAARFWMERISERLSELNMPVNEKKEIISDIIREISKKAENDKCINTGD